ncbi:MAG: hypothetical protein GXP38_05345 [Chloroflexi bacterium]|nr:hypothetical protein [Chloroflexota bacterium]
MATSGKHLTTSFSSTRVTPSSPPRFAAFSPVGIAVMVLLACALWLIAAPSVAADGPPSDYACRSCHGDNQRSLTLPSGEQLPLLVPLEKLDASAHSTFASSPVTCQGCHQGKVRYRYPHQQNPASNRRDFALAVSENCKTCHYPHNPFHPTDSANAKLPACIDCHGDHAIDRVDNIMNSMPAACLACHSDESEAWVADYIAPRPGLGEAASGYIGSDRCAGCHEDQYFSWRDTLHARMIQNPAENPEAIIGDFFHYDPDLTFNKKDIVYTIGNRWKQNYITKDENDNYYILPAAWIVETGDWQPYHPDDWQEREWRQSCGSCHVTGLNTQTWGFIEFGIGCESCHGPGADHAADPENVEIFRKVDDQVCGSCHSRGKSPEGYDFPASYRPGDKLNAHFTFTSDDSAVWPDGSAKAHHQQYMDWRLGSPMAVSSETACTTCHSLHDNGIGQSQLRLPLNDLCLQCHGDKQAIAKHMPYHEKAMTERDFVCSDHMPEMATSAVPYDIHNHSMLQPNPEATLAFGGVEEMPNACNLCHDKSGESPQWAVDTISYAAEHSPPNPAAIFGPGPTPTSPPPPTHIPSVGQPAEIEHTVQGQELRTAAKVFLGLLVLGILFWIYRAIRSKRLSHA